ncbi:Uncharacterised protein [Mycobacteroides abscessus subsp. abscessus]|nr:Uncharacterised protein [Mycobacteroides abscessus subsp. abscessus]
MPLSDEVMTIRRQSGEATLVRGTLAMTTLRSVISSRSLVTRTKRLCSAASLPSGGAVPRMTAPSAGAELTTAHGTITVMSMGVWEISGAVTLLSRPCCGQSRVAVDTLTGSSGIETLSTNPSRPKTVAVQRAMFSLRAWAAVSVTEFSVMAGLESVLYGSSRSRRRCPR